MLYGIDISNLQGGVVLSDLIPRPEFVIAKVSQDKTFVDKYFKTYRTQARALGLGFGGYHYGDNQRQPSAEASVDFFLNGLEDQDEGEIGALDVEVDTGYGGFLRGDNFPWVSAWGRRFIKLKNYKPKIYISRAGITDFNLDNPEIPDLFDLWYAWWPSNPNSTTPPAAPSPWTSFKLWQFDSTTIDKDRFLGTLEEFKATGKPKASTAHPYEDAYWTPMQKLIDAMAASHNHADSAFHATVSNAITMHKIALGVEPAN